MDGWGGELTSERALKAVSPVTDVIDITREGIYALGVRADWREKLGYNRCCM